MYVANKLAIRAGLIEFAFIAQSQKALTNWEKLACLEP